MGWFDLFINRTKKAEGDAVPEFASEPVNFMPLIEMATIISHDDPQVAEDIALLVADPSEFRSQHEAWFAEMSYPWPGTPSSEDMLFVFAYWLVGYETPHAYGAYIDWKQEPNDILSELQLVLDKLQYPVRIMDLQFDKPETYTWDALVQIARHLDTTNYTLAIIDTKSDSYHLYIVPSSSFSKFVALAESVRFTVHTPN